VPHVIEQWHWTLRDTWVPGRLQPLSLRLDPTQIFNPNSVILSFRSFNSKSNQQVWNIPYRHQLQLQSEGFQFVLPSSYRSFNLTYLHRQLHLQWIQVDSCMRNYLECWYTWLQNNNLRCLLHTRRYLQHHRTRPNEIVEQLKSGKSTSHHIISHHVTLYHSP